MKEEEREECEKAKGMGKCLSCKMPKGGDDRYVH